MPFPVPITILAGPDVSNWAVTAHITRVEFQRGNFLVRHTKEGKRPDSWPPVHIPGWGDIDRGGSDPGDLQWTLWIAFHNGNELVTSGCIHFWPEAVPSMGVHRGDTGAPFSDGARNWWYQVPGMAGRQPGPGERIGVMAVAGDQRMKDIRSVEERSDVVWVVVPENDTGVFEFAPPAPVPVEPVPVPVEPTPVEPVIPPAPVPVPVPVLPPPAPNSVPLNALLSAIVAAFQSINARLDQAATKEDIAGLQGELKKQGEALIESLKGEGGLQFITDLFNRDRR